MRRNLTIKSALLMICCIVCLSSKSNAQTFDGQKGPNVVNTSDDGHGDAVAPQYTLGNDTVNNPHDPNFSLIGTVYSGLPYIVDDNPAGFTQTYIKANINRAKKALNRSVYLFSSFYLEGYFSTNAGSLHTYDTTTTKPISYVNRLDLYQYAYAKINMHENILYLRSKPTTKSPVWKTALYFDLFEALLRTNITDSISRKASNVNSWLLGANLSLQIYNDKNLINLPMAIRLSSEVFWINPLTNAVDPDLSFQYGNRSDGANQLNINKSMTINPYPYYNLDAQVQFQISKQTTTTGTVHGVAVSSDASAKPANPANAKNYLFLHVGYVSNFASSNSNNYYNSYLTAQIGVSIDIINSIKNYTGK